MIAIFISFTRDRFLRMGFGVKGLAYGCEARSHLCYHCEAHSQLRYWHDTLVTTVWLTHTCACHHCDAHSQLHYEF